MVTVTFLSLHVKKTITLTSKPVVLATVNALALYFVRLAIFFRNFSNVLSKIQTSRKLRLTLICKQCSLLSWRDWSWHHVSCYLLLHIQLNPAYHVMCFFMEPLTVQLFHIISSMAILRADPNAVSVPCSISYAEYAKTTAHHHQLSLPWFIMKIISYVGLCVCTVYHTTTT